MLVKIEEYVVFVYTVGPVSYGSPCYYFYESIEGALTTAVKNLGIIGTTDRIRRASRKAHKKFGYAGCG